jgi:hypothetical protein
VLGACWRGILDKFWDLLQNKSKSKRKLEYGTKCLMVENFKESKRTIEGCTMEKRAKGGRQL